MTKIIYQVKAGDSLSKIIHKNTDLSLKQSGRLANQAAKSAGLKVHDQKQWQKIVGKKYGADSSRLKAASRIFSNFNVVNIKVGQWVVLDFDADNPKGLKLELFKDKPSYEENDFTLSGNGSRVSLGELKIGKKSEDKKPILDIDKKGDEATQDDTITLADVDILVEAESSKDQVNPVKTATNTEVSTNQMVSTVTSTESKSLANKVFSETIPVNPDSIVNLTPQNGQFDGAGIETEDEFQIRMMNEIINYKLYNRMAEFVSDRFLKINDFEIEISITPSISDLTLAQAKVKIHILHSDNPFIATMIEDELNKFMNHIIASQSFILPKNYSEFFKDDNLVKEYQFVVENQDSLIQYLS
ncbi:hypothetical protein BVY03_04610 [bacterium K02(2017)]|nr:hypothetical protein BVY03_04610 [bacterium K02(2017)]